MDGNERDGVRVREGDVDWEADPEVDRDGV